MAEEKIEINEAPMMDAPEAPVAASADKPVVEEKVVPKRTGSKITRIIKDPFIPKPIQQPQETFILYEDFDYPALHKRLAQERQAEIDVDRIAKAERERKRQEIKGLSGFQ